MRLKIEFRPEAEAEAYDSFDWYEERESGLGARFRDAVEEAIAAIASGPNSFPKIDDTLYRRALLDKFPFVIIFALEGDTLVIASVFHTSRNPTIWKDRIG